ncbi:MAG: TolB family protein [Gemmatimonadales bacterium]
MSRLPHCAVSLPGRHIGPMVLAAFSLAATFVPSVLRAQQTAPRVVPQYTRIFASDTMDISYLALSPDGRWIVFTASEGTTTLNLWVVPASGGTPRRLTGGRYLDVRPQWFPESDRIAFESNRPSAPDGSHSYVMVLPFDPVVGEAAGLPRRVTLEPGTGPSVSPDGESIVYFSSGDWTKHVRIVPATGGRERTLATFDGQVSHAAWTPDGTTVIYSFRPSTSGARKFMEVLVTGGASREIATLPSWRWRCLGAGCEYVIKPLSESPRDAPSFEVGRLTGEAVARFSLYRNMTPQVLTPDGGSLIAVRRDMVAPLKVLALAGGPPRQLGSATAVETPVGWMPDSDRLVFATQLNGRDALLSISLAGGTAEQLPLPEGEVTPDPSASYTLSNDGRRLLYGEEQPGTSDLRVEVVDLETGRLEVLTDAFPRNPAEIWLAGGGGALWKDGDDFLYIESRGEELQLRASHPDGSTSLLRTFARRDSVQGFGVVGSRVAFTKQSDGQSSVFVADGQAPSREILTVEGLVWSPVWSHDGRHIAAPYQAPGATGWQLLVVEVSETGERIGEPRYLEAGADWWWNHRWLPNGRAIVLVGLTVRNEYDIWLVSLEEGSRPVPLTEDEPWVSWFELSPDGQHVAYSSYTARGSSIWRVDLGDVLARGTVRER